MTPLDTFIEIHRRSLLRLVLGMLASIGLVDGGSASSVPRHLRNAVLHVLRPAEAALRRLIVAKAKGLVIVLAAARPGRVPKAVRVRGERAVRFALFDPRRWIALFGRQRRRRPPGPGPRITFFDDPPITAPAPKPAATPDDPLAAASLGNRLLAMKAALEDIPGEARRMATLQARRQARGNLKAPMRLGRPPGHRSRGRHEVDDILRECQILALRTLAAPDTS